MANDEPATCARAVVDLVLPRLTAAAHGNILLHLHDRAAPTSRPAVSALRGLARGLAADPGWVLTWFDARDGDAPAGDLTAALVQPRSPGDPGSNFIYPTMSIVERTGLAAELLDGPTRGLGVDEARVALLRLAAQSMLQDDPDHAPYGWSHCLTLPQAALAVAHWCADPSDAVAVAATYVLGFRATIGATAVDPRFVPEPTVAGFDALDGAPAEAAAASWHTPAEEVPALVVRLAGYAAAHRDAHLAKYTLACFDAADADPEARPLYLAAAAFLAAWWKALGTETV